MIDPKEIRVGNWFNHNAEWGSGMTSGPFQWTEGHWYHIGESLLFLDNVDPIELTPEILEKAGFEYCEDETNTKWYQISSFQLFQDETGYMFCKSGHPLIITKTLHHLQNLIFDIAIKELHYAP